MISVPAESHLYSETRHIKTSVAGTSSALTTCAAKQEKKRPSFRLFRAAAVRSCPVVPVMYVVPGTRTWYIILENIRHLTAVLHTVVRDRRSD